MTRRLEDRIAAGHRRIARPWPCHAAGPWPRKARTSSPRRAPRAASTNSTTRSRRWAAAPRWCRSTSRISTRIDRLGAAIFERWKKLDILVGNAGMLGKLTPLAHLDPKIWDDVMAMNVTANYRLIRSLDPLLRAVRCGPRRVRDVGPCPQVLGLLGALLHFQGRARGHGEDLCRRDRPPPACAPTASVPGPRAPACAPTPCPARTRDPAPRRTTWPHRWWPCAAGLHRQWRGVEICAQRSLQAVLA